MAENPSITVAVVTVTSEAMKLEPGSVYIIELSKHFPSHVLEGIQHWGDEQSMRDSGWFAVLLLLRKETQIMKNTTLLLLLTASLASADTITMISGSGGQIPYQITDNGIPTTVDCYDFLDYISIGQSWQANSDTLAQAAATGRFSSKPNALYGYELIGVLSTLSAPTQLDQIAIQQDLWDVFDPGAFAPNALMMSYDSTAAAEISGFDFSKVRYLEPTGKDGQAFVVVSSSTPEPGTLWMMFASLVALRRWLIG